MFNTKGITTSKRQDWKTPKALYDRLNAIFKFDTDPCPAGKVFDGKDGLNMPWGKRNFVNPPYGHMLCKWVKKAYEESKKKKLVVLLIPSRTNTRYWHDYVMKADEIWLVKGRIKFDNVKVAPFPSAIIVFDGTIKDPDAYGPRWESVNTIGDFIK